MRTILMQPQRDDTSDDDIYRSDQDGLRAAAADLKSRRDVEKQVAIRPEQIEKGEKELRRRVAERMGNYANPRRPAV